MRSLRLFIFIAAWLSLSSMSGHAQDTDTITGTYSPFSRLLNKYLIEKQTDSGGFVSAFDYRGALTDPTVPRLLEKQKGYLRRFDPDTLNTQRDAIAFWINTYNFFMIAYILDNPRPDGELLESIKDYGSFINPYRVFNQKIFNIGSKEYSLSQIEKDILLGESYRKKGWKDARVHFAVNCASVGCPPLRKDIYQPARIDEQLTENTRLALQTQRHMRIDNNTLYLTQLFEWYEEDFIEEAGTIRAFLKQYTSAEMHSQIDNADMIRFIDYDWTLNMPSSFPEISRTTTREMPDTRG